MNNDDRSDTMAALGVESVSTEAWLPIDTAPRDGRPVWVRGNNWGDAARGQHCIWAWWDGDNWLSAADNNDGEQSLLLHLTDWMRPAGEATQCDDALSHDEQIVRLTREVDRFRADRAALTRALMAARDFVQPHYEHVRVMLDETIRNHGGTDERQ